MSQAPRTTQHTPLPPQPGSITPLPLEVQGRIISHCDARTAVALAQTCKALNAPAEKILWGSVKILFSGGPRDELCEEKYYAALKRRASLILSALLRVPKRVTYVYEVQVEPHRFVHAIAEQVLDLVGAQISHLTISLPRYEYDLIQPSVFAEESIHILSLRISTRAFHPEDLRTILERAPILESLFVSCRISPYWPNVDEALADYAINEPVEITSLRSLSLSLPALENLGPLVDWWILSAPTVEALDLLPYTEHRVLSENNHLAMETLDPWVYYDVLADCKTLKTLRWPHADISTVTIHGSGTGDFAALDTLVIGRLATSKEQRLDCIPIPALRKLRKLYVTVFSVDGPEGTDRSGVVDSS